ncbi:MAG: hypothetical protein Q7T61_01130 [Caulobacter sp.]|nr:hypothetical protein [Caulobacter sp.]
MTEDEDLLRQAFKALQPFALLNDRDVTGRDRLHVMRQNPASNFHWNKSIGEVSGDQLQAVITTFCDLKERLGEPVQ